MPEISNFTIDTSDLGATKTTRSFSIIGQVESEFILQVVNTAGAFYNWRTKTFNTGHISESNLIGKLSGSIYNGNIVFPSGVTTIYNVILIAPPDSDTTFHEGISGGGKNVLNKAISQISNVVVTFAVSTANTASYGNATTPADEEDPPAANITSTGSPTQAGSTTVNNEWTVYNRNTDANGFGLRLTRQPKPTDWYFTTTETVDGAISSDDEVKVDDLTDLVVGMVITAVSGGSLSGTPGIISINETTKTLTLSAAQTFADGITLTFQARGADIINNAIGSDIEFGGGLEFGVIARAADHSITVRSSVTSTTIPITNTYGISGGNVVELKGVNTSGTNNINTVTADAGGGGGDGEIVMDLSSTVTAGTVLYVLINEETEQASCTTQIGITFTNTINAYPSTNRTIYLNLDNFITPGVSGA